MMIDDDGESMDEDLMNDDDEVIMHDRVIEW
jgi:hypothetical protein